MPRSRRKSRIRTSTESSVEIQVTEEQHIVTTTTCTANFSPCLPIPFSTKQESLWNMRLDNEEVPVEPWLSSSDPNNRKKKRKRKNTANSGTSEAKRGRSSISILYSDAEGSSTAYPYLVQFHVADSDSEDVLSVQSKTTAVVSDSSDDFWFLEEDVMVEMVELSENEDPPFEEEYEVDSEGSVGAEANELSNESTDGESEAHNEPDVDMEFWADSESSDSETDGTDFELSEADKWFCLNCQWRNLPTHGTCERCRKVRDGWLPETKSQTPQIATDEPDQLHHSKSQDHDEDINASSDNEAAKHYYQSQKPYSTKLVDTQEAFASKPSKGISVLEQHRPIHPELHTCKTEPFEIVNYDEPETSAPTQRTYPMAGVSHTWTPAADKPIMATFVQENDSDVSMLNIMSSQDSGLHDCSPQESQEYSFSVPDSLESASVCKTQYNDGDLSRPKEDSLHDVCLSRSAILERKDSGIDSLTSARTLAEEEKLNSAESRQAEWLATQSAHVGKMKLRKKPDILQTKQGSSESSETTNLCTICLNGPKEASLIHGRTGHQICCYRCAKRLYRRGQPCPVCRRRIQKVIRNYFV